MSLTWGNFKWGLAYWGGAYMPDMITDRTKDDVINKTPKGFYNFTDLNRVESATNFISQSLNNHGYPVRVQTKTDWTFYDKVNQIQMTRYLGNVKKCVSSFLDIPGLELPNSMMRINHIGSNNIEIALETTGALINQMVAAFRECGTFYCGE